jgi:hypothetical protein
VGAQHPGNGQLEPFEIKPLELVNHRLVTLAAERRERRLLGEGGVQGRLQPGEVEPRGPGLGGRVGAADVVHEFASTDGPQLGLDLADARDAEWRERVSPECLRPFRKPSTVIVKPSTPAKNLERFVTAPANVEISD